MFAERRAYCDSTYKSAKTALFVMAAVKICETMEGDEQITQAKSMLAKKALLPKAVVDALEARISKESKAKAAKPTVRAGASGKVTAKEKGVAKK